MTHRNIWVNAVTFGMHMQVGDRDVYMHTLPMFHCNGWGLPYSTAGVGARQLVLRKVDGAEILRRGVEHGGTVMAGGPAGWNPVPAPPAGWGGAGAGAAPVRAIACWAPRPAE